jgi:hypothetical protein
METNGFASLLKEYLNILLVLYQHHHNCHPLCLRLAVSNVVSIGTESYVNLRYI